MCESALKTFCYRMGSRSVYSEWAGSGCISSLMLIPSPSILADGAVHPTDTCSCAYILALQIVSLFPRSEVLRISLGVWPAVFHLHNYKLARYWDYLPTLGSMVQTPLQITLPLGVHLPPQTKCSVREDKRWPEAVLLSVLPRKQWEMTLLMSFQLLKLMHLHCPAC